MSLLNIIAQVSLAQQQVNLSSADLYVKIIGGIITGMGALLGIPFVYFQIKKTKAEIRKVELEAANLRAKEGQPSPVSGKAETLISISHSPHSNIQVTDPRFRAAILLLLDFVYVWVVITAAKYSADVFPFGYLFEVAVTLFALLLLLPIAREATRLRKVLRGEEEEEKKEPNQRPDGTTAKAPPSNPSQGAAVPHP